MKIVGFLIALFYLTHQKLTRVKESNYDSFKGSKEFGINFIRIP